MRGPFLAGAAAPMTIVPVVALAALGQTAYAGARIDVPLAALFMGAPTYVVGVLLSLFSLPPMLLALYTGRLMDRVGPIRPMIAGALLMAASLLLAAAVQQLWVLLVLAACLGLGQNFFGIALFTMVGSLGRPADRAINASWLSLGFSFGHFAGPLMTGYTIDLVGHGPSFALLVVFPLAAMALLWRTGKEPVQRGPMPARGAPRGGLAEVVSHPKTRGALAVGAVISMGWDVFIFVTPIHGTSIGLSASEIGAITGAFGFAGFVVRALLPAVIRRTTEWNIILAGLLLSGALFIVYPFTTSTAALIVLAFLLGLSLGGALPMVTSVLFQHVPPSRHGEAVGVRSTMMHALHTSMPLLFGAVGSSLGMTPVFWSVATVMLGCGYRVQTRWGKP